MKCHLDMEQPQLGDENYISMVANYLMGWSSKYLRVKVLENSQVWGYSEAIGMCLCHGYDVFMTRVMLLVKGEDYGYSTCPGRLTKHKKNPTNGSYDHQFISSLHHTPLFLLGMSRSPPNHTDLCSFPENPSWVMPCYAYSKQESSMMT